jgi:feruloyl esterase
MAAQRFPADFDGIVAGAPVLDFVGTVGKYTQIMSAMARGPLRRRNSGSLEKPCTKSAMGLTVFGTVLSKTRAVAASSQWSTCRSADPQGTGGLLHDAQIATLDALYSDQHAAGKRVFPGWPVGVEAEGANGTVGWVNWLVATNRPPLGYLFRRDVLSLSSIPGKAPGFGAAQRGPRQKRS